MASQSGRSFKGTARSFSSLLQNEGCFPSRFLQLKCSCYKVRMIVCSFDVFCLLQVVQSFFLQSSISDEHGIIHGTENL